jgi:hypothetical protein
MKKKNYLLLATAAIALVACTADDDLSAGKSTTAQGDGAIVFNMETPATTRAAGDPLEGNEAAGKLGKRFIVWGEKNEKDGSAASTANKVFENYKVEYTASTAGTTASNSSDWEYVGLTPYIAGTTEYVYPSINGDGTGTGTNKTQTIKYWDTSASSYTFTAVSALDGDITGGHVKITKTESGSDVYDKGYSIVMDKDAHPENIYVADRVNKTDIATAKSQAVQMTFRNFQSKIRFGFYETVPGYYVQITSIGYTDASDTQSPAKSSSSNLIVNSSFYTKPSKANETITYKVTYEDGTSTGEPTVNKARVVADGATAQDFLTFGGNIFGKNLGTTSTSPTYDTDATDNYTAILPNIGNTTNMTFKVSYKLISEDTGEEIAVTDRQVTVPAVYCQWKPNFSYTYLFKVSDQSAELYPITFDAVVEEDQTTQQKTITEVAGATDEVSITTLGVKDNKFYSDVDEYAAGTTIYASVAEGETVVTSLTKGTDINLYTVTATKTVGGSTTPVPEVITEAAVANCIKSGKSGVEDLNGVTMTITASTLNEEVVSSVPAEDGGTDRNRTLTALKWTDNTSANTATYYAVEYIKASGTAPNTTTTKYYKIVKVQ